MRKKTSIRHMPKTIKVLTLQQKKCKSILTQRTENTVGKLRLSRMEGKKKDGGAYEPATLELFQRGLQRYLNEKNCKINAARG